MLLETLKTLLSVYGPTGNETQVAEAVKKIVAGKVDHARIDVMGNLIIEKKGQEGGKKIMISAHMDHIGMVVVAIEKDGFLRVTNVGGLGTKMTDTRHVVFQNGVHGVAVCQPTKDTPTMATMFVDIGAEDKEDAEKRVSVGDVCVFANDTVMLGQHRVAAPAMDDRCACALLAELLIQVQNPRNTIVAVFSTQEEVGMRGAKPAAYAVNPDIGIGLDVTGWGDTPEVKYPDIKLGKGAGIKIMDRSMISTPWVRDTLIHVAEKGKIPYQREVLPYGGTDGAAIQQTRGGIPSCTVSIPCRYVHSACEVIDMRDMNSALEILKAFVNTEL